MASTSVRGLLVALITTLLCTERLPKVPDCIMSVGIVGRL